MGRCVAVAGMGYVGLSVALLLAQHNEVRAFDIDACKIECVNKGVSPFADAQIEAFLAANRDGAEQEGGTTLRFTAYSDPALAYAQADFVVIATPTDYDPEKKHFDTSCVEAARKAIRAVNSSAWIVIKSTVPVGYTKRLRAQTGDTRILFSPEFLREGHALADNLDPSRIIVGIPAADVETQRAANEFAALLAQGTHDAKRLDEQGHVQIMPSTEAEAAKLFSNSYLALRVAYFNELDTYAQVYGLDTKSIIEGVCADPRIGDFYNNPSFGYGGYCLPKDSKQLLANYEDVPQQIISATVSANETRMEFIAQTASKMAHAAVAAGQMPVIGIYRLTMKTGSDNFRASSVQGVIRKLRSEDVEVLVYEPTLEAGEYLGNEVVDDLTCFKQRCHVVLANRWSDELLDVEEKVYTCDLYGRD